MIRSKTLNLNGLKLDGEAPITPRTMSFCEQQGMIINQANGYITVTGRFYLKKEEVDAFLSAKQSSQSDQGSKNKECQNNVEKTADVSVKSFAGMRKGFLI